MKYIELCFLILIATITCAQCTIEQPYVVTSTHAETYYKPEVILDLPLIALTDIPLITYGHNLNTFVPWSGEVTLQQGTIGSYVHDLEYFNYMCGISYEVYDTASGNGIIRTVLKIGDSLTDPNKSIQRIRSLMSTDVMDVNFVGTQDSAPNQNEGYGGKTYDWHYSNTDSPFVFSGSFDFSQYLSSNSITMSADDWVIIQLGTNDIFGSIKTDAQLDAIISTANNMINDIKSSVSGIRIAIATVHRTNGDTDAWIDNYGATNGAIYQSNFIINQRAFNLKLQSEFENEAVADVHLVPIHAALSKDLDYPVSPNAVHPADQGYDKIGDYYYYFLKSKEN